MTELEELAKKAIEAERHLREDYGLDTPGWTGAEVAMKWARDEFRSVATPQAILTLIQEKREARSKALEDAAQFFEQRYNDSAMFSVPQITYHIRELYRAPTPGETS